MHHLTAHQQDAIQRARDGLGVSETGTLPEALKGVIDPKDVTPSFWRGYLERTLRTLIDELELEDDEDDWDDTARSAR